MSQPTPEQRRIKQRERQEAIKKHIRLSQPKRGLDDCETDNDTLQEDDFSFIYSSN